SGPGSWACCGCWQKSLRRTILKRTPRSGPICSRRRRSPSATPSLVHSISEGSPLQSRSTRWSAPSTLSARFLKAAGTPSTRPCRDSVESLIVGKMKAGQGRQRASNGDPVGDTRDRLGRAYDRYRRSGRKRRAWAADNPGNVAIRQELLERLLDRAGPQLRSG